MKSFKFRLILVFVIIAFAILNASAAGTVTMQNVTPYANCSDSGNIISYTMVFSAFSGHIRFLFYIDGALVQTLGDGNFGSPTTLSVPNSLTAIISGSRPANSVYQLILETNGTRVFDYSWDCTTGLQVSSPVIPTPSPSPTSPTPPSPDATEIPVIPAFSDGRLNRYDAAAPVALYLQDDGLAIYAIDEDSEGQFVFFVSLEDIEILGIPIENTLLGSSEDGLIALWRLPNGQFMLQAPTASGKTYYLYFDSLGEQVGYISYEI